MPAKDVSGDTVQVEAASDEKIPAPIDGKPRTVSTQVWTAGKTINREFLFSQAVANVRDAVPVASYDVACEVKSTKAKTLDKNDGTAWTVEVTFTPRVEKPEAVDLEKVIAEAKAGYGDTHPGDPDFLSED
jgi:hypothetical protein